MINIACGSDATMKKRADIVPLAQGRVLEVGMGSGLNLPFYDTERVEKVWGLEPSEGMRRLAQPRLDQSTVDVHWLDLPGEEIPLDNNSIDTVLLMYTLCTIPDWHKALQQMHRVLKPGGTLVFCEHGIAPDTAIRKWQNRLNPLWKKMGGGCHLNRPIPQYLEAAGFKITSLESAYMPGTPKIAGFNYWGIAE